MGWRKVVHKCTGKCMGRGASLSKGEVRVELITDCDGETLAHIELYKFGELVEEHSGSHGENVAKISEWIANHAP
jgi:hypothetical protein